MMAEVGGESFVSALYSKYENDDEEQLEFEIYVPKSAPGQRNSGQLVIPAQLALNYGNVTHAGTVSDIVDILCNVCELDLSKNKISEWREVFEILRHLPRICFLNLSDNPLWRSQPLVSSNLTPCISIRQLVLNATKISWETVSELLKLFPQLRELHLSLNECSRTELSADLTFPSITSLYLNSNDISRWSEIRRLGRAFPSLESLVMMSNPFSGFGDGEIEEGGEGSRDSPGVEFPQLKSLNIGHTPIRSWEELDRLRQFPSLVDVRLHGIMCAESTEEKLRRQLMIARLPNVQRLNGSPVSGEERETAHRVFVRHYVSEDDKPPRYFELVAEIGELEPFRDICLAPPKSVRLKILFEETTWTHRFSLSSTTTDIKRLLSREFVRLPPTAFTLQFNDIGSPGGAEEMKYPQRTLLRYRAKDDDEILVRLR